MLVTWYEFLYLYSCKYDEYEAIFLFEGGGICVYVDCDILLIIDCDYYS